MNSKERKTADLAVNLAAYRAAVKASHPRLARYERKVLRLTKGARFESIRENDRPEKDGTNSELGAVLIMMRAAIQAYGQNSTEAEKYRWKIEDMIKEKK